MRKYMSAPNWDGSPLEELGMWAMLQPGAHHKPDIPLLKEAVHDLCHMAMQKTAGQRKDRPKDISWDCLSGIKWTILMEACVLVLSGELDKLDDGDQTGVEIYRELSSRDD